MPSPAHRDRRTTLSRVAAAVAPALVLVLVVAALAFDRWARIADDDPGASPSAADVAASRTSGSSSSSSTSSTSSSRMLPAMFGPALPKGVRLSTSPTRTQEPERSDRPTAQESPHEKSVRDKAERAARRVSEPPTAPFDVRIGTFNVLGSQHTGPGGERKNFPPASVRSARAASLVAKHGVDIVGMQELQADQLNAITSRTGMQAWPGTAWGSAETDNSILYDPAKYQVVSGERWTIPFMGRPRPQPIVKFKDLATGREFYVVNTHPSAHGGRYLAERRRGQDALVGVVRRLAATGLPVLATGDMNDREIFYCRVVGPAAMSAPNGGSSTGGCHPPPQPIPVDWVVGRGVTWSNYWRDTSPVTNHTSDHFFISAVAHVG